MAATLPIEGPATRTAGRVRAGAAPFVVALLFACLVLQRFGLPFGGKAISIVGPLGLGIAAWGVLRGDLGFDRVRLGAFAALAALALLGAGVHALQPGPFGGGANIASLSQFLLLTGFAVLGFTRPMGEGAFIRIVTGWLGFIATAGIVQFLLQLAGLPLFAFTGVLPAQILFEFGYNLQVPTGVGDLLKSNGFFLVEPSVFSQLMALGLVLEVLSLRRPAYLGLMAMGLLLSFSGTGWVVLASFLVAAALGMGWRGVMLATGTAVLLAALLVAATYVAPDLAGSVQNRVDEVSRPGTSGHQRFITPFWAMSDTLAAEPAAAFVGIGSGVSERLTLPYAYDVNTPVKVALDYGFPALLAYVLLFVGGRKSPVQRGMLVPAVTAAFATGGYQQFPPMLFLILLITSVAWLEPD